MTLVVRTIIMIGTKTKERFHLSCKLYDGSFKLYIYCHKLYNEKCKVYKHNDKRYYCDCKLYQYNCKLYICRCNIYFNDNNI